jgi:hypothetical protein
MPLRSYWTIMLEGKPTAFRSPRREDLLPTLGQLQSRHPDAHLLWFANGKLWRSPVEAMKDAMKGRRHGRARRPVQTPRRRG